MVLLKFLSAKLFFPSPSNSAPSLRLCRHLLRAVMWLSPKYRTLAIPVSVLEPCADVIVSAAARRSISVGGGGGAGPKKSAAAARRGAAWAAKNNFFLRFTKKFRSYIDPQYFL